MGLISEIFPPIETALQLEPEELAVYVLEALCRFEERENNPGMLHRGNFTLQSGEMAEYAGLEDYKEVAKAVIEAWVWLEREGLIAPRPGETGEGIFITRRGWKFRESGDVGKFKAANLLPAETLDPTLASKVRPAFLRGDYDTAVLLAFKEVEIRVRKSGGYSAKDIGTKLMRKAFHIDTGNLTDTEQVESEEEGIGHLFAGAIAAFKNPGSHRDINIEDPVEVVELIAFADLLIKIAERRKPEERE